MQLNRRKTTLVQIELQVIGSCYTSYFQAKKSSNIRNIFFIQAGTVLILLFLYSASNSLLQEKTSHLCHGSSDLFQFAQEHHNIPKLGLTTQHSEARLYMPLTSGSSPVFHIMKHDRFLMYCTTRRVLTGPSTGSDDGYWERWMRLVVVLFVCSISNLQIHTKVKIMKRVYLLLPFKS